MVKVKAIKIRQNKYIMYLASIGIQDIKLLFENNQLIIDTFKPSNPPGSEGYQRELDEKRIRDISQFLSTKEEILPPLLPSSLILNCRESDRLRYNQETNELDISDASFHVVDGQHRISGLKESKIQDYDIPVTILEGLSILKEAGQFLVINTKQKKIKPDLQLRILHHQEPEDTEKLTHILSMDSDNWKLEALDLAIVLNDTNDSPWRNLIRIPGEDTSGKWKPIPEGHFVETLKFICTPEGPMKLITNKGKFLIQYWDAIRKLYSEAFSEEKGKNYSLCGGKGAGIFHTMAPLVYYIADIEKKSILDILKGISKKFPLEDYWRRPRGKITKSGSGQGVYRQYAETIIKKIDSRFDYFNSKEFDKLERRTKGISYLKTLRKARTLLSPLILKSFTYFKQDNLNIKGCYVFLRLENETVSVYIGKTKAAAKERLKNRGKVELFAVKECSDEETENLEMALFHILKPNLRENKIHPPKIENCPYCN